MPSVADFSLSYDKINDSGTFSEGDTIRGKVSLELLKATKVLRLSVKAKGDVNTKWTQWVDNGENGETLRNYGDHRRLLKKKQFLISTKLKETVLSPGSHSFSFDIQIPSKKDLPSSFSGEHGSIRYQLEAKLCRRLRRARKVQEVFNFLSKTVPKKALFIPQTALTKRKNIKKLKGGNVKMEVWLERNVFAPGEMIKVVAKVTNSSEEDLSLRMKLKQDVVYLDDDSYDCKLESELQTSSLRLVGPLSEQEEEWGMPLSPNTPLSIHNCKRIKLQYSLVGALKVQFSKTVLEVSLPLVIITQDMFPPGEPGPSLNQGSDLTPAPGLYRAMPSVADFSLSFDKINNSGTFSEGDTIRGKVSLELLKATKVLSLSVKAKGDVNTKWTLLTNDEECGETLREYGGHRRLFKKKQFLISTKLKETVLSPGSHSFSFDIQIPSKKYLPSSFSGEHGSIRYQLEAKLCRRLKRARKVQQTFNFWSKSVPKKALFVPQTALTKTNFRKLKRGDVILEVRLERNVFAPSEMIKVVAKVTNSSEENLIPRMKLKQDVIYSGNDTSYRESETNELQTSSLRLVGPRSEQEEEWGMFLSPKTPPSIHNCKLIKLEYSLVVALEMRNFSTDLEISLPLVIIFSGQDAKSLFPPGGKPGPS
ncbi:hypothetical protein WMY93_004943 [Mugilogobius chulae]|uniref:Arrestin C-terminal-like domain-containing protein n=1 Tax=Mugilogobius chulae TaxID=88201 RepID=A0AAW0PR33_9GOBI